MKCLINEPGKVLKKSNDGAHSLGLDAAPGGRETNQGGLNAQRLRPPLLDIFEKKPALLYLLLFLPRYISQEFFQSINKLNLKSEEVLLPEN